MTDHMVITCPYCSAKHNRHASIVKEGEPPRWPEEGAVSLCFQCGEWTVFDERLDLRKPTEAEAAEIVKHPLCQKVSATWHEVMRMMPRRKPHERQDQGQA